MSLATATDDLTLVGHSVVAAADSLGLKREQLAYAIGVSVPTVARMRAGAPIPNNKPFELALLLIRIYRALYAIVGGDQAALAHWMNTPNRHLSDQNGQAQIPSELVQNTEGLARVLWYLDAMRGRI